MTATTKTFPRAFAAWFSEMERWDVAFFRQVKWNWPEQTIRPLGEAIIRRTVPVNPDADPITLPIISKISFGGELTVTSPDERIGYKGRLFWAEAGDLIYSKIRVKQGSLCIVPDSIGKVAVSAEYPVYKILTDIADPDYLALVVRSTPFMRLLEGLSHGGSTKTRISPEMFQRQMIPLPPLHVQRKIVAAWETARKDAAAAAEKIAQLECDIEARFLADLGIDAPPFVRRDKYFVLPWTALERWSVKFNRWDWALSDIFKGKHPLRPLEELAWVNPSLVPKLDRSAKVSFVPMESVDAESGEIVGAGERELAEVAQGFTAFQDGDVIWAKITPCMQNGKCALARGLTNGVGYGSTEFHVIRSKDTDILVPEFLWALLRLQRLRDAAQRYFIGSAGQQRVPPEFLRELPIPAISSAVQRQIVERIARRRAEIAKLKAEAKARAEAAKADVEAMILGAKPV